MSKSKLLYTGPNWDMNKISKSWKVVDEIAKERLGLSYYEPQFEIVSFDNMLDALSSHGLPNMYNHWSFGKSYAKSYSKYLEDGHIPYEIVINTDPAIAYLVENNTMTEMLTVICHASVGHSNFFKENYCFKQWTQSKHIIDYLEFAKDYIQSCEDKYGIEAVEKILDAAHSMQYQGFDKYPRKRTKLHKDDIKTRTDEWNKYGTGNYNEIYSTIQGHTSIDDMVHIRNTISELSEDRRELPEENLLYFIEKHGALEEWERELVRIVRKISQYFYPQIQTKMMNEGWATWVDYSLMKILHDDGYIDDGSYLEFLELHSAVAWGGTCCHFKMHQQLNVYALGFSMFKDLNRICLEPTKEDERYYPEICNTDPWVTLPNIMKSYRDESFVLQYLSKPVVDDFKIIITTALTHKVEGLDEEEIYMRPWGSTHWARVLEVADEDGLIQIRKELAKQFDLSYTLPQVSIVNFDDDLLELEFKVIEGMLMYYREVYQTLEYLRYLWGGLVTIDYVDENGIQTDMV